MSLLSFQSDAHVGYPDIDGDKVYQGHQKEHLQNRSVQLFSFIAETQPGNFVFSPDGTFNTLALVLRAASDDTWCALNRFLGERYIASESTENGDSTADEEEIYATANAVLVSSALTLQQAYRDDLSAQNHTTLYDNIDFTSRPAREALAENLNHYFCKATRGKISKPCRAELWHGDTLSVFINSVYFKGLWEEPFEDTHAETFTLANGEQVCLETVMERILYNGQVADYHGWQAVVVPYKKNHEMIFILPPEGVMPQRATSEIIAHLLCGFQKAEIDIVIPPFTVRTETDLIAPLAQSGLDHLFRPHQVALGGMIEGESVMPPYLSTIQQNCVIEVDSKGTEAAALNQVVADGCASIDQKHVSFNHPFMYMLLDKEDGKILFMGQVLDPR